MTFPFEMWSAAPFAGLRSRLGLGAEGALARAEHVAVPRASLADLLDEGFPR